MPKKKKKKGYHIIKDDPRKKYIKDKYGRPRKKKR
jgi:hypothetical protein